MCFNIRELCSCLLEEWVFLYLVRREFVIVREIFIYKV